MKREKIENCVTEAIYKEVALLNYCNRLRPSTTPYLIQVKQYIIPFYKFLDTLYTPDIYFDYVFPNIYVMEHIKDYCNQNNLRYVFSSQPYFTDVYSDEEKFFLPVTTWEEYLKSFKSKRRNKIRQYIKNDTYEFKIEKLDKSKFDNIVKWNKKSHNDSYNLFISNKDTKKVTWEYLNRIQKDLLLFCLYYKNKIIAINLIQIKMDSLLIVYQAYNGIIKNTGNILFAKMLKKIMDTENKAFTYIDHMSELKDDPDVAWKKSRWNFKTHSVAEITNIFTEEEFDILYRELGANTISKCEGCPQFDIPLLEGEYHYRKNRGWDDKCINIPNKLLKVRQDTRPLVCRAFPFTTEICYGKPVLCGVKEEGLSEDKIKRVYVKIKNSLHILKRSNRWSRAFPKTREKIIYFKGEVDESSSTRNNR